MLQNKTRSDKPLEKLSNGENDAKNDEIVDKLPPLQDRFGRTFDYVRIAVTEKCNLRCTYCMPEEGVDLLSKDKVVSDEEILRIIRVLARMGVRKVRFTGGEPLVRKDIIQLVEGAD